MAIQRRYEVVRLATTRNQFLPSPETVLSKHKDHDAARKAFDAAHGKVMLVEWYGNQRNVLDAAIH